MDGVMYQRPRPTCRGACAVLNRFAGQRPRRLHLSLPKIGPAARSCDRQASVRSLDMVSGYTVLVAK
jgi:hypothetical protein